MKNQVSSKGHKINDAIKGKFIFLIDQNGQKLGNISIIEAKAMAVQEGMDLVQVGQNEDNNLIIPVCKIMDYGRFCFELKKNKAKTKKENKLNEIKEIQIKPMIEENDYQVKMKKAMEFVKSGNKVNVILKFKGRQNAHPEIGLQILERFAKDLFEVAKAENTPKVEGRRAVMVLSPK